MITRSDGTVYKIPVLNGILSFGSTKLPVNATLGTWGMSLHVGDPYGNNGTTDLTFQVLRAVPIFTVQSSPTTQRTALMNVTASITYPDGLSYKSQVHLMIRIGNETWTPKLTFNATTSQWTTSFPVAQNATLGPYNITITAGDPYDNYGIFQTFSQVISANFAIHPNATQSEVGSYSLLDLPVHVSYPNGTSLNSIAGTVNATFTNSTSGGLVTVPLVYNATEGWWHLFFYTPQQGNFTFSFNAIDIYVNSGLATNAYSLKVVVPQTVITRKLIIAAVAGAIIPIALLAWAITAISTRRRKHKP
jgi:hypothetical protein